MRLSYWQLFSYDLILCWRRPGISKDNVHVGGCKTGDWFQVPELSLRDHYFVVPLDHGNPDGSSITIFAREVVGGTLLGSF